MRSMRVGHPEFRIPHIGGRLSTACFGAVDSRQRLRKASDSAGFRVWVPALVGWILLWGLILLMVISVGVASKGSGISALRWTGSGPVELERCPETPCLVP